MSWIPGEPFEFAPGVSIPGRIELSDADVVIDGRRFPWGLDLDQPYELEHKDLHRDGEAGVLTLRLVYFSDHTEIVDNRTEVPE